MKCTQCQNEMELQERFCSKCGRDSQLAIRRKTPHDWDTHVKVLAWIFIALAMLMAIPGLSLMLFPGVMMFAGWFPRFPMAQQFMALIAIVYLSLPALIVCTGVGLLKYRSWGRIFALILSGMMLIVFPFGTAAGVYGLWVLSSMDGGNNYKLRSATTAA